MKILFRKSFFGLLSVAGLYIGLQSCSSDQQEMEDPIEVEQGNIVQEGNGFNEGEGNFVEGNVPEENQFNNLGDNQFGNLSNEQFNNLGNEQFNNFGNDQFSNIGNDQFNNLNSAPFNNAGNNQFNNLAAVGNDPLVGDNGQGDLEEIIDEINNVPVEEGQLVANTIDANIVPTNVAPIENVGTNNLDNGSGDFTSVGAPAAAGLPEIGSKMSYVVEKGDTLVKIATRIYGDPERWTEIASFTGLANPRLIYPGDVVYYQLTDQSMAFAAAYENVQRSEVEILEGDTLSSIAGRVLGNPANWKLIWRQNDNIDNPDRLTAGTKLYYVSPGVLSAAVDTFKKALSSGSDVQWAGVVNADQDESVGENLANYSNDHEIFTGQSQSLDQNDTQNSEVLFSKVMPSKGSFVNSLTRV